MSGKESSVKQAEFENPGSILSAGIGFLIILAACAGVIMVAVTAQSFDVATFAMIVLGFAGACALGVAFINTWRRPMLTIRPDAFTVPTTFGTREIAIKAGHPVGEFLASSHRGNHRAGTIESNKFVHFYTLDAAGALVELVAMHRAAPEIAPIRRAFTDVAGLKVETLNADPKSKRSRPDVAHWKND